MAFYFIMHASLIAMEDLLIVILLISLLNKSLYVDLYQIHNLPTLHPKLKVFLYPVHVQLFLLHMKFLYVL